MPRQRKSPPPPATLDDATRELVRAKARQIAYRVRLPSSDLPDLEQEIAVHVWNRLARFDPARLDRDAFIRMLVGHAAATAYRGRVRRTRVAPCSLDQLLLAAQVPDGPDEPADRRAWPGPGEARALALDVTAVLSRLPKPLRRIAESLKSRSVAATARRLKMSRQAVYRRLAELRAAFAGSGLEEYLPEARTLRARRG